MLVGLAEYSLLCWRGLLGTHYCVGGGWLGTHYCVGGGWLSTHYCVGGG